MTRNIYNNILLSILFGTALCIYPKLSLAADIPASASRTTGVAPLSVHFNADLTASSPTERSFHDLEYSWDFGDPGAGNWGTDGLPKNTDKGPVSAHVYETPGTFTATLTVRNETGIIDTDTFTIIVTDPELVFANTKTTCISTGTDWTGCPGGASHVTTNDLSGIGTYADAGERVLLRRGDVWIVNTEIAFPQNTGPVQIGAFGACASPDSQDICSNAPNLTLTGTFLSLDYKNDWRISDIAFTAEKTGGIFGGVTDIKNIFIAKLNASGFQTPVGWSNWRYNDLDYIANNFIVSSRLIGSSGSLVYAGGENLVIMGNVLQNSDTTHVCRVWNGYQSVIGHNILSGSSLTNTNGRHALKLHGPNEDSIGTFLQTSNGGQRNKTQFAIVHDNVFGASGPWPVSIGPADGGQLCNMQDIIIEKNKMMADYGTASPQLVQVGLMFEGRYITARNNIIDGTGSSNGYTGIFVARRGIEWTPLGNRVYNNTVYSRATNLNGSVGVAVHIDADDTVVRNNFISFANAIGPKTLVVDDSGTAVISNNVMTNTPYFTDPNNINPLLRNFSLTSQSTEAIDQGITVPVFDDFAGTYRTGTYDIGAYTYDSGDVTVPSAPSGLNVL